MSAAIVRSFLKMLFSLPKDSPAFSHPIELSGGAIAQGVPEFQTRTAGARVHSWPCQAVPLLRSRSSPLNDTVTLYVLGLTCGQRPVSASRKGSRTSTDQPRPEPKPGRKGEANSLDSMRTLVAKDCRNSERIFPYLAGEEVNSLPTQQNRRYVIDFADFPLRRDGGLAPWPDMHEAEQKECLRVGIVPLDYAKPVAEDWPDLLEIVTKRVKPYRLKQGDKGAKDIWWQFQRRRPKLYAAIASLSQLPSSAWLVGLLRGPIKRCPTTLSSAGD
jgi:hypothetical protein